MRKFLLIITAAASFAFCLSAQVKKPTIMVVPSDNWCITNGYSQKFDNQGNIQELPDYKAALQNNSDLLLAISKIGEMMSERGFPLKDLEGALKTLENQAAEDALLTSKSGSEIAESPIDKLKKTAKADIIIQMTYTVNQVGPKKSLTFNLQGKDAYTDKQIAAASGTGSPSFTPELAILIEEAVLMHIDNFNSQLMAHFEDMFANGREIRVRIKVWDGWEDGLETEYNGEELSELIQTWMNENTVNGANSLSDATENMMVFEQVRIPLSETTDDGKTVAIDARKWVLKLRKHLKSTYGIESKLMMRGLGEAQLVIGEK